MGELHARTPASTKKWLQEPPDTCSVEKVLKSLSVFGGYPTSQTGCEEKPHKWGAQARRNKLQPPDHALSLMLLHKGRCCSSTARVCTSLLSPSSWPGFRPKLGFSRPPRTLLVSPPRLHGQHTAEYRGLVVQRLFAML